MSKSHLYAWGANSHGQLGLGFKSEMCTTPHMVDLSAIDCLDCGNIIKIIGGAGHTLILDSNNRVYSCGWNNRGQAAGGGHFLDDPDKVIIDIQPINHLENERIIDIACGWDSSMGLTENGQVYVWGSNSYGQLGRDDCPNLKEPTKIDDLDERIRAISMGLRHSALVTESGRVLVTGSGNKGQLGIVDAENNRVIKGVKTFTQISAELKDVMDVACGQNHTVALTKTGDIYSWGDNKHGQLGMDNAKVKVVDSPTRVLEIANEQRKSLKLRAGWTHTIVMNDDGSIETWGRNDYGQLGYRNDDKNSTWIPRTINFPAELRQLSVGSEHNLVVLDDGSVLSWGWNEHGNCGVGSTHDVFVPKPVQFPSHGRVTHVGCGAGHSFAITLDDK